MFDIVDENGVPTGERVSRSVAHRDGIMHRTAHVAVLRRENGKLQILLQKRAANKDSFPGCYDMSSAGHIDAGEEPLTSAMRELKEELSIDASDSDLKFIGNVRIKYVDEFHGEIFRDNEIAFLYVYEKQINKDSLKLQEEEVEDVQWFDLDYVIEEIEKSNPVFCVPTGSLEKLKECEADCCVAEDYSSERRESNSNPAIISV